ncbi:hypothetical protein C8R44DRAFT_753960 [Mycena epipterygia]|nr:hypothetical protein C8R44DRAFT_753960 [Mycena epipterygia]
MAQSHDIDEVNAMRTGFDSFWARSDGTLSAFDTHCMRRLPHPFPTYLDETEEEEEERRGEQRESDEESERGSEEKNGESGERAAKKEASFPSSNNAVFSTTQFYFKLDSC